MLKQYYAISIKLSTTVFTCKLGTFFIMPLILTEPISTSQGNGFFVRNSQTLTILCENNFYNTFFSFYLQIFSAKIYTNSLKKLIVYLFKRWHYDAIIIDVYFCLTPPSPHVYKRLFLPDTPSPLTDDVFYECRLMFFVTL